jgi:hypothetical protein
MPGMLITNATGDQPIRLDLKQSFHLASDDKLWPPASLGQHGCNKFMLSNAVNAQTMREKSGLPWRDSRLVMGAGGRLNRKLARDGRACADPLWPCRSRSQRQNDRASESTY